MIRHRLKIIFQSSILAVLIFPIAILADSSEADRSDQNVFIYAGLLVDQTITPQGQEFYQLFASWWRDKPDADKYVLSIKEKPSANYGSQIRIDYDGVRIFESTLPVSRNKLKDFSEQAVEAVYEGIVDHEVQAVLEKDVDFGKDEI